MIRVRHDVGEAAVWWNPMDMSDFGQLMADRGIVWGERNKQADVVLCDSELMNASKLCHPTILFELWDDTSIVRSRSFLNQPSILGLIKPVFYRELEEHNGWFADKNRLGYRVWRTNPSTNHDLQPYRLQPPVSQEMLDRTHAVTALLWDQYQRDPCYRLLTTYDRYIDVAFLGTTFYPRIWYTTAHRRQLSMAMAALPLNVRQVYCSVVTEYWRLYQPSWAYDILSRAKVCVCPWGVSELCWRDYEAVLAGCVLIKPLGRALAVDPNPWEDAIWCQPDYSDLHECICRALDTYDAARLREKSQALREQAENKSLLADQMARAIHDIVSHPRTVGNDAHGIAG